MGNICLKKSKAETDSTSDERKLVVPTEKPSETQEGNQQENPTSATQNQAKPNPEKKPAAEPAQSSEYQQEGNQEANPTSTTQDQAKPNIGNQKPQPPHRKSKGNQKEKLTSKTQDQTKNNTEKPRTVPTPSQEPPPEGNQEEKQTSTIQDQTKPNSEAGTTLKPTPNPATGDTRASTGETGTPTPRGETPTPRGDTGTPTGDTGTPTGETGTPTPTGDTRTPTGDTRTPTGDTRTPTGDTRTPTGDTRTPTGDTRTPTGDTGTPTTTGDTRTTTGDTGTPTTTGDTRTPTGDTGTPTTTGDTGTPTGDTRTPTGNTRTPTGETGTPTTTGVTGTPTPTGDRRTPTGEPGTPTPTGEPGTPTPTGDTGTPTPTGDTGTPTPTGDTGTPTPTGDRRTPTGEPGTPTPTGDTGTPTPTGDTGTPTSQDKAKQNIEETPNTEPTQKGKTTSISQELTKENIKRNSTIETTPSAVTSPQGKEDAATSTPTSQDQVQDDVDQTQVIDSTSYQTPQVIADGESLPTPAAQDEAMPSAEPEPTTQTRAVIFSLEDDDGIRSLEKWTRRFVNDCQHLHPTTTSEDWKTEVEKSSIVIFYSPSLPSGRSIEGMKPYIEYSISKKGHEGVILVHGGIQASEDQNTSWWVGSRCELHVFTETDLQWILQDPQLQDLAEKIKQMRDLLPGDSQKMMISRETKKKGLKESRRVRGGVVFIPESAQSGGHWLEPILRTDGTVDVTVAKISEIKKLLSKVTCPACCVLHFTEETFRKNAEPPKVDAKVLRYFKEKKLGVIVVVDDLDDERSEEELRAQYKKSTFSQLAPLFLFRREEKQKYQESLSSFTEAKTKLQESIERRVKVPESPGTCDAPCSLPPDNTKKEETDPRGRRQTLGTVGIFSRSSITDYSWMETLLKSPDLSPYVRDVRPFYISNNQTLQLFEELRLCRFGVLYHTKNRGRVNVTDVTDSLYDEELETMSLLLGRDNVLVVIDDVSDSSASENERIRQSQPSIYKYAYNLLLVTEEDKKDKNHIKGKLLEALMSRGKNDTDRNGRKENNVDA